MSSDASGGGHPAVVCLRVSNRTGLALRVQLHVTRRLVPARTG